MPSLDWIGKKKVVNHHLEVPFRVLEKKYDFYAEGGEGLPLSPAGKPSFATPSPKGDTPLKTPEDLSEAPLTLTQNDTSNYRALTTLPELTSYIDSALKAPLVAYDSETDGLDTISANILGFSLCYEAGKAVYIPIARQSDDLFAESTGIPLKNALTQLLRLFQAKSVTVAMHNAKFDLKVLATNIKKAGFKNAELTEKILESSIYDTMIYACLQTPELTCKNCFSLESLG